MAFMTKKSQIQAWLNGLYMENLYGQRMTSKHVHARRRPGVPAPVMIKRNPIFHHLWRSEQYSAFAFFISQSKSDFHYQHIIRVPAGLFALKSCSCCCCPLPFKLRLFQEPFFAKCFFFLTHMALCNVIVPLPRSQTRHPAHAQGPLPLPHMRFCQEKSLQTPPLVFVIL